MSQIISGWLIHLHRIPMDFAVDKDESPSPMISDVQRPNFLVCYESRSTKILDAAFRDNSLPMSTSILYAVGTGFFFDRHLSLFINTFLDLFYVLFDYIEILLSIRFILVQ